MIDALAIRPEHSGVDVIDRGRSHTSKKHSDNINLRGPATNALHRTKRSRAGGAGMSIGVKSIAWSVSRADLVGSAKPHTQYVRIHVEAPPEASLHRTNQNTVRTDMLIWGARPSYRQLPSNLSSYASSVQTDVAHDDFLGYCRSSTMSIVEATCRGFDINQAIMSCM